jgi:hypothetical protein
LKTAAMKKTSFTLVFIILIINGKIMAQAKDSVPAKKLAEKGAQGDVILGKQNKKSQLNAEPQMLQKDSVDKPGSTQSKRKKSKIKNRKN